MLAKENKVWVDSPPLEDFQLRLGYSMTPAECVGPELYAQLFELELDDVQGMIRDAHNNKPSAAAAAGKPIEPSKRNKDKKKNAAVQRVWRAKEEAAASSIISLSSVGGNQSRNDGRDQCDDLESVGLGMREMEDQYCSEREKRRNSFQKKTLLRHRRTAAHVILINKC